MKFWLKKSTEKNCVQGNGSLLHQIWSSIFSIRHSVEGVRNDRVGAREGGDLLWEKGVIVRIFSPH